MAEKVIEAIRGLERDRFRAMVDGNGPLLDELLSDNVSYIHTNGKRETKQQFIDGITAGRRRYRQIEIQSQDVLPAGRETFIKYLLRHNHQLNVLNKWITFSITLIFYVVINIAIPIIVLKSIK